MDWIAAFARAGMDAAYEEILRKQEAEMLKSVWRRERLDWTRLDISLDLANSLIDSEEGA